MTGDGGEKNPAVEGHDGEHEHVTEAGANGVQRRLEETRGDIVWAGFEEAWAREPLEEQGDNKDQDQGESIHAGACSRPTGEENLSVLAPEEGHVDQMQVCAGDIGHRRRSSHIVMRRFPAFHLLVKLRFCQTKPECFN